jgi:hypothetical protein
LQRECMDRIPNRGSAHRVCKVIRRRASSPQGAIAEIFEA